MIITKNWLNEFIDINDISTKEICDTLNAIGLEVDSVREISIPKGVVVGEVLACEKHPDADKLSLCKVDIGGESKQIVCGAKNVAKGQFVAVATIGADLGGGFVIKEAKLRGIESFGMICSSSEIGLGESNDGILVLDESIGALVLGRELSEYHLLNDTVIEIELTANRGDCLSIRGVARDLSAALNIPMKELELPMLEEGLDVQLEADSDEVSLIYQEGREFNANTLIDIRLALVEKYSQDSSLRVLNYVMHTTGVLLRSYNRGFKALVLKEDEGIWSLYGDGEKISQVGISQSIDPTPTVLIEASYIKPDLVSKSVMGKDISKDALFYNASRGSESDLEFGLRYLNRLTTSKGVKSIKSPQQPEFSTKIEVPLSKINNFIGQKIEKERVVSILEKLRFRVNTKGDLLEIEIPTFRSDIANDQDIIEEIVRMVGIDEIVSTPLTFRERNTQNSAYHNYKKTNFYRTKASVAFFETIHYFFDSKERLKKYNLSTLKDELDLLNPITNELNTLRTTLLMHLLESASSNLKHGKNGVRLFEIGRVVDADRVEKSKIAFIASGDMSGADIGSGVKGEEVDFIKFAKMVTQVIGDIELKVPDEVSMLENPYESARVLIGGRDAGFMARVALDVERDFDLPRSYICEIDFDAMPFEIKKAKPYSKYPSLNRDISLLVPKEMRFDKIASVLADAKIAHIINFYPIDRYESSELGDRVSLTVRFVLQSDSKTLEESDINSTMDAVLKELKDKLSLELR